MAGQPEPERTALEVNGAIYNYDERELDSDYFTQPGKLWRLMSAEDQRATCENTARAMGDSALFIKHSGTCATAPTPIPNTAKAWRRHWVSTMRKP